MFLVPENEKQNITKQNNIGKIASKIFFSHQKVYFWISAFDHRAIILDKMHIVQWWAPKGYPIPFPAGGQVPQLDRVHPAAKPDRPQLGEAQPS